MTRTISLVAHTGTAEIYGSAKGGYASTKGFNRSCFLFGGFEKSLGECQFSRAAQLFLAASKHSPQVDNSAASLTAAYCNR